ncbi:MAG: Threonine dehydrogenase [Frankiales bacterium]|nr:Threonine dehydrogenase [Frankiales bacterium]
MRALTWQGKKKVSVEEVPDPTIQEPTDAIIKITTTNICGSDLHLYEPLGPFMHKGDVLGHEPMGVVVETGTETGDLKVCDRVVIPFQIACGHCWMCTRRLPTQCETTQVRDQGMGAPIFGYSELYGRVPGGQAEYLRVPQAQFTHVKVPDGLPDERFVYLSDVLPTAWQAVEYAHVPEGGTVAVLGLGPIGDMACRIAQSKGYRVIGIDLVAERLQRQRVRGVEVLDLTEHEDLGEVVREMTGGRGPDSVIDAVGLEAHGSPVNKTVQKLAGLLPDIIAKPVFETAGVDRLGALYTAIDMVRRGGTISLSGVYGGMADPLPMLTIFDKQINLTMGQGNVKRWAPEILPLLVEGNAFDVDTFHTHSLSLDEAPDAYRMFQEKTDGCVKVILKP